MAKPPTGPIRWTPPPPPPPKVPEHDPDSASDVFVGVLVFVVALAWLVLYG